MFAGFKISERVAIEFEREISIKKLESRSKDGETDFFGEKLKHIASGFDDIKIIFTQHQEYLDTALA